MQKPSATVRFQVEVNSLTLKDIDNIARIGRTSRELAAAVILTRGFSNLNKVARPSAKVSFA